MTFLLVVEIRPQDTPIAPAGGRACGTRESADIRALAQLTIVFAVIRLDEAVAVQA
jgi:hypothetical protein